MPVPAPSPRNPGCAGRAAAPPGGMDFAVLRRRRGKEGAGAAPPRPAGAASSFLGKIPDIGRGFPDHGITPGTPRRERHAASPHRESLFSTRRLASGTPPPLRTGNNVILVLPDEPLRRPSTSGENRDRASKGSGRRCRPSTRGENIAFHHAPDLRMVALLRAGKTMFSSASPSPGSSASATRGENTGLCPGWNSATSAPHARGKTERSRPFPRAGNGAARIVRDG